eukprot:gb/GECH01002229.1/.p1 GENE.gb/GECH01002229.1/~~gb/GECH01002229.1/.p1  ORF type:complete len:145 (+),score=10.22 gb/GECH01002229.1/:1-435(+)
MSPHGKTALIMSSGNVISSSYISTLREANTKEVFDRLHDEGSWIFQQDNASPHLSAVTFEFLSNYVLERLDWPAQAPDFNPIENMWSILKRKVAEKSPDNIEELKDVVKESWENIPQQHVYNTCMSIQNRIEQVIEHNGWPIRY